MFGLTESQLAAAILPALFTTFGVLWLAVRAIVGERV